MHPNFWGHHSLGIQWEFCPKVVQCSSLDSSWHPHLLNWHYNSLPLVLASWGRWIVEEEELVIHTFCIFSITELTSPFVISVPQTASLNSLLLRDATQWRGSCSKSLNMILKYIPLHGDSQCSLTFEKACRKETCLGTFFPNLIHDRTFFLIVLGKK